LCCQMSLTVLKLMLNLRATAVLWPLILSSPVSVAPKRLSLRRYISSQYIST
jgi:hypothetical protein